MQRVIIDGTLAVGGTTSRTVISTASMRPDQSAAIWWMTVAAYEPVSVRVRSIDNDINLGGEILVAEEDQHGTVVLPMGNVPWFVGPQGDGLEVYVVAEHDAGTARYSINIGLAQAPNRWYEDLTEQEEIP